MSDVPTEGVPAPTRTRAQFLMEMGIDPDTLRPPTTTPAGGNDDDTFSDAFLCASDLVDKTVFVDSTPPIGPHSSSPMKVIAARPKPADVDAAGKKEDPEDFSVPPPRVDEFSNSAAAEAYNRLHIRRRQELEEFRRRKKEGLVKTLPPPRCSRNDFIEVHRVMPQKGVTEVARRIPATLRMGAPAFEGTAVLPDGSFQTVTNADFAGTYLVLFFYGRDFTELAASEVVAFSRAVDAFAAVGCGGLVGCSVDSSHCHLAWRNSGALGPGLAVPLLSDVATTASADFGVELSERCLFVVDPRGVVRHISRRDPSVAHSVEHTLEVVTQLQRTDTQRE